MNPKEQERFNQIIEEGYQHSSAICMEQGLRMYRSAFRVFATYALIIPLAGSIFGFIGLGSLGLLIFILAIMPGLNAGFYLGADAVAKGEKLTYKHFFKIFTKDEAGRNFIGPVVINSFLATVVYFLVLTPIYFLFEKTGMWEFYAELMQEPVDPPEPPIFTSAQSTIFLLGLAPFVYLQVAFSWAFPLILFYRSNALVALDQSRQLVTKKWFTQFMLAMTFFSMFFLGSFLITIFAGMSAGLANVAAFALFLIFPWVYCSFYLGFRSATLKMEEPKSAPTSE